MKKKRSLGIFGLLGILFTGGKYGKVVRGKPKYYFTDRWKEQKKRAFEIHGKKCAVCGTSKNLQVHHVRYYRNGHSIFGRENIKQDLRVLCKTHHGKGKYGDDRIKADRWFHTWFGL